MDALRDKLRVKQYSYKTEKAYLHWTERYIRFHKLRHPKEMGKAEVEAFLTHLAKTDVSSSTQNQALQAILFMYREMFDRRFENIQAVRAKGSTRIPVVLTVEETKRVLCRLQGVHHIIAYLLYGGGLRLTPALACRCKCGMSAIASKGH